jgi:hypothetical protein
MNVRARPGMKGDRDWLAAEESCDADRDLGCSGDERPTLIR